MHWSQLHCRVQDLHNRYHPRFFDQIGHQTTSACIENKHFFTKSCHCQTYQPTKNGPIFRKQSTSKFSKNAINKSWSPNLIFFTEKNQKDSIDFWCSKMTLNVRILQSLRRLFIILVGLTMTWFIEKMLIFNICRHGLMPNLIKKSWTVSNLAVIRWI